MHRGPFQEALTWLEIHGQAPEVLEHWRGFIEAAGTFEPMADEAERGTSADAAAEGVVVDPHDRRRPESCRRRIVLHGARFSVRGRTKRT